MDLHLSDRNFCLFLLAQFPFASDDMLEMTLTDYLPEHFDMPTGEWLDELTGKTDDPWNGHTYMHRLNASVTFYAEFHPHETVYFFNDTYLGNTGGHFHLSLLSWEELQAIVNNDATDPSLLFWLLLPLTIGKESERSGIEAAIAGHLKNTALDLQADQLETITRFVTSHLIFSEEESHAFEYKTDIGLVTHRGHSERNHHNDVGSLTKVNEVIYSAIR
ncbi:Imm19 family immunity protein [Chitinophaga varians]|uniref:Imm19 family immunity protein n=1 Tax=Chitinophaga varians TaxID=2202339 RepID=UPI00165FBAD9|nr:Imm19 family immunity protein [Chitinophaga varians]MBC9909910.1 immunity protein 19 [Chitinophaga varians]